MTEGRLEVESKSQECLVIIKREVTSNNLPKRRVLSSTHGVVGGRRLVTASYPIFSTKSDEIRHNLLLYADFRKVVIRFDIRKITIFAK